MNSNKKSRSTKRSLYRGQHPVLAAVFESVATPRDLLLVPVDYAKGTHMALIADGTGRELRQAFEVENSAAGVEFLLKAIRKTAKRRKIPLARVIVSGEDLPAYCENFARHIALAGPLMTRVSARLAAKERENLGTTTDKLALDCIAKVLISRRAMPVPASADENGIYRELRDIVRERSDMVDATTATGNRIHTRVDVLLPGFLDSSRSLLSSFTGASLELMEERFSGAQVARRRRAALEKLLRRHHVHEVPETAEAILALAQEALPADPVRLPSLQRSLTALVRLRRNLSVTSRAMESEAALLLATTPYALLTSIGGVGFVLASGTAAELGSPASLPSTDSMCAYAGIVPGTLQSGGPQGEAFHTSPSRACNHHLKNWTVQAAQKIRLYGQPELKDRMIRWEANGQHAAFAGARRYLRLTRSLVTWGVPYLDPEGRPGRKGVTTADKARAAEAAFDTMVRKWKKIPGGIDAAFAEDAPIGRWAETARQLFGAHLEL